MRAFGYTGLVFDTIIDFVLHLDSHLDVILTSYGTWAYAIMFLVIFAETGLVATPFLPGDSLLFALGAFAARGSLNLTLLLLLLSTAAIGGDSVNYWFGNKLGRRAFSGRYRFFKKEYLEQTERFYERYGSATIILARFVPLVRTFAPFLAGIGRMAYGRFLLYNVVGGLTWVATFLLTGYFLGNIPIIQKNFSLVIFVIIVGSLLFAVLGAMRRKG